ncbi:MAG: hypothetical protein QXD77_00120 [Candidatus Aenigmatarchaeota archaeon]
MLSKAMFNSGLSAKNRQRVREMYDRHFEPITIAKYLGADLARVNLEINAYEREMETRTYMGKLNAMITSMVW